MKNGKEVIYKVNALQESFKILLGRNIKMKREILNAISFLKEMAMESEEDVMDRKHLLKRYEQMADSFYQGMPFEENNI